MKKPAARPLSALVLATVLGGLACAVSAAPLTFLNQTITASVPAKDVPALRKAVGDVLNHAADKSTTQWTSSHGPRSRQVQMALTPLQTSQTQKADTCRLLNVEASRPTGKRKEEWQFWFCKQADGTWKASAQ